MYKLLHNKRILSLSLIVLVVVAILIFRHPQDFGREVLKRIVVFNGIFILVASVLLQWFFMRRYRTIRRLFQHIAETSSEGFDYNIAAASLIKKNLRDSSRDIYLVHEQKTNDHSSTLSIVCKGETCEFIHHVDKEHTDDLASVLIYYLEQDIPYDLLYDATKSIHTPLDTHHS